MIKSPRHCLWGPPFQCPFYTTGSPTRPRECQSGLGAVLHISVDTRVQTTTSLEQIPSTSAPCNIPSITLTYFGTHLSICNIRVCFLGAISRRLGFFASPGNFTTLAVPSASTRTSTLKCLRCSRIIPSNCSDIDYRTRTKSPLSIPFLSMRVQHQSPQTRWGA
ncbi:hypothetical protein ASPVEDRAFT_437746 [Aspergillus versicolor CBS 583.65]|uniref:Uncharacterized protein n=1 Tax=Aspergillus versicolor CBS 583.65 TaxID=1036611 RepID=A0A1L9P8P5_ASPVE|nr:uncharacterized protein ASPVEDRAFT_437746 [Aspergillus versicolor CBS 583.65]OJI97899.1 hypothetical protein ASPVEDRAFT_437746 [Aspergillus versicolor CBS 583.65]